MGIRLGDVIDWTEEINLIECKERNLALEILERYFDVECVPVSDEIKHYPISTVIILTDDDEENAALRCYSLGRLNKQLWATVLGKLGNIDLSSERKLGKLKYCTANKFAYRKDAKECYFRAYCFEYNGEIQAEINFTIEFY